MAFVMLFIVASGFAQESSRKAKRERERIEKQQQIQAMIEAKEFVFVAARALPSGGGSIDLTTNTNYVKFRPDTIESYMPFFGRAYSIEYGGDGGIKFEGKPEEFKVVTRKEGRGYDIHVTVSVTRDSYKLSLSVGADGNATMTVTSNQRSSITYNGHIEKVEVSKG